MKDCASFTSAVASMAPACIRKPRRECSIKASRIAHAHLEVWRPTVAFAGHIVVPPLPVKAGWRGQALIDQSPAAIGTGKSNAISNDRVERMRREIERLRQGATR